MNIDEIRKISLVEFLNQLGYQPTGRDSKGLWFYAPYRSERKPSFHVNPRRNLWYDFGTGAGGDIFSLAGEMSGEMDFLRQADYIAEKMRLPVASSSERRFASAKNPYKPTPFVEEPTFENIEVSRLESPVLLRYLADRGIPKEIAQHLNRRNLKSENGITQRRHRFSLISSTTVLTLSCSTRSPTFRKRLLLSVTTPSSSAILTMTLPVVQLSPDSGESSATGSWINRHYIPTTRI